MTDHPDELARILAGGPTADRRASARLLREAAAPSPADPPAALLAAMAVEARSALDPTPTPTRNRTMIAKLVTAKVAAVAAAVTITATGAAAAGGALPDAAQDGIAKAASHVGVDLPDSGEAAEDLDTDAAEHGEDVSTVATDDSLTGADKGAAVSDTAKDGHGSDTDDVSADTAGDPPVSTPNQGDAATTEGNPASDDAPVDTPNHGTAADDAPAGSDAPAGEGIEHSDGAAEAGAANADRADTDADQ